MCRELDADRDPSVAESHWQADLRRAGKIFYPAIAYMIDEMVPLIAPCAIGAEDTDADGFGAEGRGHPDVDHVELLQIGRHHAAGPPTGEHSARAACDILCCDKNSCSFRRSLGWGNNAGERRAKPGCFGVAFRDRKST